MKPYVAASLVAIAILLASLACGSKATAVPTATPGEASGPITQEQAIQKAIAEVTRPAAEATPVQNPRNPVVKRMTANELAQMFFSSNAQQNPDRPVWLVQLEGESQSGGLSSGTTQTFRYALVAYFVDTGAFILSQRRDDPLLPTSN